MTKINKIATLQPLWAFTLAEVLIVLGIIGLVADMTIPTLVQKYQKQVTITKLQKLYTILSQATKLSEIDNGSVEYWDTTTEAEKVSENFDKYWRPYLRISKICETMPGCGYKESGWDYMNKQAGVSSVEPSSRTAFYLNDGSFVTIFGRLYITAPDGNLIWASCGWIFVDVNGSKPPNTVGKDAFRLMLDNKGELSFYGFNSSDSAIKSECSSSGKGETCGAKIQRDGWKINEDYPW